jgi:predicted nucleic acid-binding protein
MTVHLDTSALIDALTGPRRSLPTLVGLAEQGHRLSISAIVLYEWLRGPRSPEELAVQEDLFPGSRAVAFGTEQAVLAARLYRLARRARGREIDLAIAATALHDGATLWTLNRADFTDIGDLSLL